MGFKIGDNEHIHLEHDLSGDEVELLFGSVWRGPKGDRGDKGDIGEQGPTGPQGVQGEIGPMGPKGLQGPKGDQGPQGERGYTGDTGARGPQGEKGEKGDRSDKGEQGDSGERGLPGLTGPKGPKGDKGDNTATFIDIDATNGDHELLKGQIRKAEQALRATAETLIVVRDGGIDYTSIVAKADKGILRIIACAIDEPDSKIRAIQIDATYTQCAILTVTVVRREQSMSGLLYVSIGDITPDTEPTTLRERLQPAVDRAMTSTAFPVIGQTDDGHIYGFCRWEQAAAKAANSDSDQRLIISFCGWVDRIDGIAFYRLSLACSVADGDITTVEILSGPQTESLSDSLRYKADLDKQGRYVRKEQINPSWEAITGISAPTSGVISDTEMPECLHFSGNRTYEILFTNRNSLVGDLGGPITVFSDGVISLSEHHYHAWAESPLSNRLQVTGCTNGASYNMPATYHVAISLRKKDQQYEISYYVNGSKVDTGVCPIYDPEKLILGGTVDIHAFRVFNTFLDDSYYAHMWNDGEPFMMSHIGSAMNHALLGEFIPAGLSSDKWHDTNGRCDFSLTANAAFTYRPTIENARTKSFRKGVITNGSWMESVDNRLLSLMGGLKMSVELSVTTSDLLNGAVLFSTIGLPVAGEWNTQDWGYLIGISENGYWCIYQGRGEDGPIELTAVPKPTANTSYHVVLSRNNRTICLYIDNKCVWTITNGGSGEIRVDYLFFAAPGMCSGRCPSLYLHSIRFFNDTLTTSEIAQLWNSGAPLMGPIQSVLNGFDLTRCMGEFVPQSIAIDPYSSTNQVYEWRNLAIPGLNLYSPGVRASNQNPTFKTEHESIRDTLDALEDYTLPPATADVLGGIKVGDNLTVDAEGRLCAPPAADTLPPNQNLCLNSRGGARTGWGYWSNDGNSQLDVDHERFEYPVLKQAIAEGGSSFGAPVAGIYSEYDYPQELLQDAILSFDIFPTVAYLCHSISDEPPIVLVANEWQRISFRVPKANAQQIKIGNANEGIYFKLDIYFKNIQLEYGSEATPYSYNPGLVPFFEVEQEMPGEFWLDANGAKQQVYARAFRGTISKTRTMLLDGVGMMKVKEGHIHSEQAGSYSFNSAYAMSGGAIWAYSAYILLSASALYLEASGISSNLIGAAYIVTVKYTKIQ